MLYQELGLWLNDEQLIDENRDAVFTDTNTAGINARCQSLSIGNNGNINVNAGKDLKDFEIKGRINDEGQNWRRRRRP